MKRKISKNKVRVFTTGGTRDTDIGKLDFEGFLHPLIEERFAEYMHKHRLMPNGQLRDSDNWQKLFGDKHKNVCIKSLFRHFLDMWKIHRGLIAIDRKTGEVITQEDAICAIIFNAKAYLYKLLLDKKGATNGKKIRSK